VSGGKLGLAALAAIAMCASVQAAEITGAGSTFVYPILSKWSADYSTIQVNYQSIGSGGGLVQIKAGTVDFRASDTPMKPAELQKFGMRQFPPVIGGIAPFVNIDGVQAGQMRLTGPLLADIFLGKIRDTSVAP
jgi:phosphate transport system substrate-binding protein